MFTYIFAFVNLTTSARQFLATDILKSVIYEVRGINFNALF